MNARQASAGPDRQATIKLSRGVWFCVAFAHVKLTSNGPTKQP